MSDWQGQPGNYPPPQVPGRPMPSPAQVAQQAVGAPPPRSQGGYSPPQPTPPPPVPPTPRKGGGGAAGRLVWLMILVAFVVAAGVAAGSVLSEVDAVVVVEEKEALPDWMPYAVAGGVAVAGLFALIVGGPRPELIPSWLGLGLVTYGSGLGLERVEEISQSDAAREVLTKLDSAESLILAGAGLVLVGQVLAVRRFMSPRPIAAVRALLGTGILSALTIAVALTSVLHAGVEMS